LPQDSLHGSSSVNQHECSLFPPIDSDDQHQALATQATSTGPT
jgi:hypothetical protein